MDRIGRSIPVMRCLECRVKVDAAAITYELKTGLR